MTTRLHRLAGDFGWLAAAAVAMAVAFQHFNLRVALTDSSTPAGIYQMRPASRLSRGELVAACLPLNIASFAISRGYLAVSPLSDCSEHAAPIGKRVLALPGDEVEVAPASIAINGQRFANSATASRDSRGRNLPHMPAGEYRVPPGSIWLFGFNDSRSFDSRYYGPVPLSSIQSTAVPLLTW